MDVQTISLDPLKGRRVAILGYGNQGRAQALNLRDSGISVTIGARPGKGSDLARKDGFEPVSPADAVSEGDIVGFLLPDSVIPAVYSEMKQRLAGKTAYFSHGYAWVFGGLDPSPECRHFLIGPKGAGAILREKFEQGSGLPGVYAVEEGADAGTRALALAYGRAAGIGVGFFHETSFREETICDLFGEQVVLCGGIPRLLESAYATLRKRGMSAEMAFFECCYEARMILDLWLKHGPREFADRISPVAFFGGTTRGRRVLAPDLDEKLERILDEIETGTFAAELEAEVGSGTPRMDAERKRLAAMELGRVYDRLKGSWET